jgi:16S rRNA (cytosine1402-N4)-methyltransferase
MDDETRNPDAAALHTPVLADRIVALLAPSFVEPGSVLVDCTLGMGGHSEAVLDRLPESRVVGIDRDREALDVAGRRLQRFGDRFVGVHATYDELAQVLGDLGLPHVAGVLLDLGVSSLQLDRAERGFAYRFDSPLDMRMDSSRGATAADLLNQAPVEELTRILREYGEEKFARKLALEIVRSRETEPFDTSAALVELIYRVIPAPARRTGGHPAKRTFQALRMAVNDELGGLERVLPAALEAVGIGGRVVVEAYHSLEDRMVKRVFTEATRSRAPEGLPIVPAGLEPPFRSVTRGAEVADDQEIALNPRAASVRLRAVERLHAGGLPRAEKSARAPGQHTQRTAPHARSARTGAGRNRSTRPGGGIR